MWWGTPPLGLCVLVCFVCFVCLLFLVSLFFSVCSGRAVLLVLSLSCLVCVPPFVSSLSLGRPGLGALPWRYGVTPALCREPLPPSGPVLAASTRVSSFVFMTQLRLEYWPSVALGVRVASQQTDRPWHQRLPVAGPVDSLLGLDLC